ncbi:MAG: MFS transporter [Treponema sp.]|jgi:predicted MFS family arabinose efflux permease|nr:MFS transporter [Treponema sp.]
MIPPLSPYRQGKARAVFNIFNTFNALSWNLLVGSIITLFALRLGASSTYIGILSALLYMSLFFLPLGKMLAQRFKIVSIYSFAWVVRALGMIPVVFAPLAAYTGHHDTALGLTMLGVAIFHIIRGIGMIGNNPVLSYLSAGSDQGSYLTQIQIINSATGMFSGFAIAIILGRSPPLFLYSFIMTVGVICGITSGVLIKKIPEPPGVGQTEKINLTGIFREALSQPAIKLFLTILLLVALVSGVSRTFLVVYAREVFIQEDGMILLFTVFGGLGNLLAGMLIKFFVDKIGAKPIFIICTMVSLATLIPIVFFPSSAMGYLTTGILFLSFLFFMLNFGFLGSEGIAQTYFMGLVPSEKTLDMGILYFFVFGVAGAGGSFLAGLLLDMLTFVGCSQFVSFKILYAIIIALTVMAIYLQRKLVPLGALSLGGAVKIMFSYRELQAISLLDRLNKTQDSRQEELLLGALHDAPSPLAIRDLLERARSPRLVTRFESIRALERLENLSEDAETALMNDIVNNPFTTAYISARILGNHGCVSAIPLLRDLVSSTDYMLAGESMIALAKLWDTTFCPQIEQVILHTDNPRLKIMGAESLGIFASPRSLYSLLEMLRGANPPPYLRDEVVLAMAAILDTQSQFYRLLVCFHSDANLAPALAMDEAEAAYEFFKTNLSGRKGARKKDELPVLSRQAESIQAAVSAFVHEHDGSVLSRWILELPSPVFSRDPVFEVAQTIFSEVLLDNEMASYQRLHLLIIHWAAYQIRSWTNRLKT